MPMNSTLAAASPMLLRSGRIPKGEGRSTSQEAARVSRRAWSRASVYRGPPTTRPRNRHYSTSLLKNHYHSSMAVASRQVTFKGIDIIVEDEKTERGFQKRKAQRIRKKVRSVVCCLLVLCAFSFRCSLSTWSIQFYRRPRKWYQQKTRMIFGIFSCSWRRTRRMSVASG